MGAGASSTPNAAAALTSTTLAAELRSLADAVDPVPLAEQTEAQGEVLAARLETLAANVRKSTASPKVVDDSQKLAAKAAEEAVEAEAAGAAAAVAAADEQPQAALTRYNDIDAIEAFAAEGDVGFVYASYYLELAAQEGGRFPRRQEVPPHAVVGKAALKRMADEVRAWRKLLAEHKDKPYLAWAMRFPPFVVVSYAWLSREHPDPDGKQLREVLAPTIEWYMAERARLIKKCHFEGLIGAAARLDAPFTAEGIDFAIFVDYCGVWQHERTPVQAASFGRGLGGMVRACTLLHCNRHSSHFGMCIVCATGPDLRAPRGWRVANDAAARRVRRAGVCGPWLALL